jgi:putative endonuclease
MYVYILKCSDNSYYTGVTRNLEKRLSQHYESEDDSYVSSRRPFEHVFYESFENTINAIEREKQIKGWSRQKKEALINSDWDLLHSNSECRNLSHYMNKELK